MWPNAQHFMVLRRAMKPVICKVHGVAVAGGSDIARCADFTVLAEDAQIGSMPARVWVCATPAMWEYLPGAERDKRMRFTGDNITGKQAAEMGVVLEPVFPANLNDRVEALASHMATFLINQLAMPQPGYPSAD